MSFHPKNLKSENNNPWFNILQSAFRILGIYNLGFDIFAQKQFQFFFIWLSLTFKWVLENLASFCKETKYFENWNYKNDKNKQNIYLAKLRLLKEKKKWDLDDLFWKSYIFRHFLQPIWKSVKFN